VQRPLQPLADKFAVLESILEQGKQQTLNLTLVRGTGTARGRGKSEKNKGTPGDKSFSGHQFHCPADDNVNSTDDGLPMYHKLDF
jgi:hypothetical protein